MTEATILRPKLSVSEGSKLYAELRGQMMKDGVFIPSYSYYFLLFIINFTGFITGLLFLIFSKNLIQTIFASSLFAFFTVQFAGIMHDAGHRSIFKSVKYNNLVGYFITIILASGFEQWRVKHNEHHAHSNEEEGDPDMRLPILSFSKEIARKKKGLSHFLVRYQHFIYYPLGTLVIFSTRLNNISYLRKHFKWSIWWQVVAYVLGLVVWYILPFVFFDFIKALTFFITFQIVGGIYMFQVFAPNHKGMPYITKGTKVSFLEQQIVTSRNLYSNWLIDYLYLGLNYQIEHHLFPGCPRNKLKVAKKYVEKFCKKHHIEYTEVGLIETNRIILSELHDVALSYT